jgi:hypothetical protein
MVLGSQSLEKINLIMNINFFYLVILSLILQSCSYFNSKNAELKISSNPSGALILVEGRAMGRTPTIVNLPPKKYMITLQKEGYGSAIFETEGWASIKTKADGSINADGYRCLLDSLNPFLFFNVFLKNCRDFKKKTFEMNIAQDQNSGVFPNNNSMMGIGNIPQNMIYYNYNPNQQYQYQAMPNPNQGMVNPNQAMPNPTNQFPPSQSPLELK